MNVKNKIKYYSGKIFDSINEEVRLSNIMKNLDFKKNNLDFIRFFAAFLVILSHSFPISYGSVQNEPFRMITGNVSLGTLGVFIFFIISGFLITMSFERANSIYSYFYNRVLRIYPAMIFVVFLTAFIIGPIISDYSIREYFANPLAYKYLQSATIFDIRYHLPGVFFDNPYPKAVNGSLWTLRYELLCYIVVAIIGILGLLRGWLIMICMMISVAVVYFINSYYPQRIGFIDIIFYSFNFFIFFGAGMLAYIYRKHIVIKSQFFIISLIIVIFSAFTSNFSLVFSIFGTYCILYLGFQKMGKLYNFSKYGDFSYGMYIYAFFIQQIVAASFPAYSEWWFNVLISTPFILMFAILSWHLVEKRALALKNKI